MLVNSALKASPRDAEFQEAIARELTMIERFFHRCFVAGQTIGGIPATRAADDAARHLPSMLQGIHVLARVRPERKLLTGAVRQALKMLDLPPLAKAEGRSARASRRKS
jgi:TetR/AcrR family transcriptional repressor of nem operon